MAGRFVVNKLSDEVALDLNRKLLASPALGPYIVAQIAGQANVQIAVPGILSGSVPGFGVKTGLTKEQGLGAVFRNGKNGFSASLFSKRKVKGRGNKFHPIFYFFTEGTSRGISPRPLWESFDASFQASGISRAVIEQALSDFDKNNIPDLQKYLLLGIRTRRRR